MAGVIEQFDNDSDDLENGDARKPIIQLDNIHKTYLLGVEGVAALRGVSLDIYPGEWVVILGPSGGGKTSMLNMIGTIDAPTKGSISICGVRITQNTPDEVLAKLRRDRIGFVFQTFNLLGTMKAAENVELPMVLQGTRGQDDRDNRAKRLLNRVGLGHRRDHLPTMLSGGEQQRVTIARAITNQPDVLLLDEPTGDLDSRNTNMVVQMLRELNQVEGLTLVMVTHDMGLKDFADRVVWMRDGKIQRVENITAEKKREKVAQLEADLLAAGVDKVKFGLEESDHEEIDDDAPPKEFSSTSIRPPISYDPYRYTMEIGGQGTRNLVKYLERTTGGRIPEHWLKPADGDGARLAQRPDEVEAAASGVAASARGSIGRGSVDAVTAREKDATETESKEKENEKVKQRAQSPSKSSKPRSRSSVSFVSSLDNVVPGSPDLTLEEEEIGIGLGAGNENEGEGGGEARISVLDLHDTHDESSSVVSPLDGGVTRLKRSSSAYRDSFVEGNDIF